MMKRMPIGIDQPPGTLVKGDSSSRDRNDEKKNRDKLVSPGKSQQSERGLTFSSTGLRG